MKNSFLRKKLFIIFIISAVIILFILISPFNLFKSATPGYYSYSFLDHFKNASKTNFDKNLILENYLPIDKNNSFYHDIYNVLKQPAESDTVYLNRNGQIIQDKKTSIRDCIINFDLHMEKMQSSSYSLIFKQNGPDDYWMLNIRINRRFTVDLYQKHLKEIKRLHKYSGDLPENKHLVLHFFSIEDRLFVYSGNEILFGFSVAELSASGFYSFTEARPTISSKYTIKISKLAPETLEKTPYRSIPKEATSFNFNQEGYDRMYIPCSENSEREGSTFLRRIKCLELPSKKDNPYLTVTKPSIIFPLDSSLEYDVEIPLNAVMTFSLSLLNENYFDNYRAEFIIRIISGKTGKSQELKYHFNYNNRAFKNYSIDIGKYSGETCKITFEFQDLNKLKFSYPGEILAAMGAPKIYSRVTEKKKNIILISLDTLRQDHLSCYGYKRDTSRFIDEFSRDAMVFDNAVSNSNSTLPSHMSMFTSLFPSESGFLFGLNNMFMENKLPDEIKLLGEYMNEIGLRTGAITGGNWVSSWIGYDRGFDSFIEWLGKDIVLTVDRAIDWLESNKDYNFFLFLHTYEIHKPYTRTFYTDAKNNPTIQQADIKDKMIASYDSGIRFADEYVGHLIQWLKENNLYNNTLIIITSDHGENFDIVDRSDNLPGTHGKTLYDAEIKIPLLVGGAPDFCKKGRYSMQVSNVDILPSILDYFNIQPEQAVRGSSLLQIIKNDNTDRRVAYSEYMDLKYQRYGTRSLRTVDDKFIQINRFKGTTEYEFYDLQNDRNELNNLIGEKVAESRIFMKKLLSIIYSLKIPEVKTSDLHDLKKDNFRDIKDKLRSLGYLRN